MHHDLQRSGRLEDMLEDDRAGSPDRPAGSLRDPPTYEEVLLSLGRAPTEADLGPQSPESHSSSLVLYATEEDSDPEETQEQQEGTLEQMEADGQDTTEAPVQRGMGISMAPKDYQPAPPRYIKAGENSEDEENGQDKEENLEAPYLAPKLAPSSSPAQNEGLAQIPMKGGQTPANDLSESELSESIPELIDQRDEGEKPSPFPPLSPPESPTSHHAETASSLFFPTQRSKERYSRGSHWSLPGEGPRGTNNIYVDDDMDPSPLQLLKRQVDSLLMLPPADTTPMAQKTYRSLGRGLQLLRMPENEERSPGTIKGKTLQERRNTKALKLKIHKVAKMHMGPVDATHTQELAKLTSTEVPLQRLKIRDDGTPVEGPAGEHENKISTPPQK